MNAKCLLSGFCAFRDSCTHSPHPHLYPRTIQHSLARFSFLKCSSDDITLLLKNFQGLPSTAGQIKCTSLVLKPETAVLHIHMTCIFQEASIFRGHVLFYLIKSFQRSVVFVPMVKTKTKHACRGMEGVLFCFGGWVCYFTSRLIFCIQKDHLEST